jgi:hypothetical protein
LLRDPVIQEKYQFMLYLYPTGVPIPIAAAGLRETLSQAKQLYDPNGQDPEFDQMVLLGHSMGGLLSHFSVVESDDQLWRLYSDKSFREIIGPPEILNELSSYLFFKPLPFVKRVVFLATPHRGSELSRSVVGRVSANLISDPDHINKLLSQLLRDNADYFDRRRFRRFPSSIETLEPDSPILTALLSMRPSPDVTFHSIIGSTHPGAVVETTDGVVPYRSAHLDGAASEKVVRSDHGVQKDGEAIKEVRRILFEHLSSLSQSSPTSEATRSVPPVQAETNDGSEVVPTSAVSSLPDLPPLQ